MKNSTRDTRGFTLMELLVVIAIIGILSSVGIVSLTTAQRKAQVARAQADLRTIQQAMEKLASDTGSYPSWSTVKSNARCQNGDEMYVDDARAGIVSTDGNFNGWDGPYLDSAPKDPWGSVYYIDGDYQCGAATVGCDGAADGSELSDVIMSLGPNKVQDYGDGDDVVMVLCKR